MADPIPEQYAERIKEFFPDVDLRSCELNTEGLVNDVVLAEGTRVFRFPKNDNWAREWLEHETRVLNLLAVELDVRVPEFDVVQDDFVSYRMIPGEPLYREDLLKLERPAPGIVGRTGSSVPPSTARGVPGDSFNKGDL